MENEKTNIENLEVEYSNNEDYIRACSDAISTLNEFDFGLMDKAYEARAKQLREKIFEVLEKSVIEMYNEVFVDSLVSNESENTEG